MTETQAFFACRAATWASWVGTAKTLVGLKDRWHGTLMFIAQPAEEIVSGAKAMIADGLFTRFKKPDFGFALHDVMAEVEHGQIEQAMEHEMQQI